MVKCVAVENNYVHVNELPEITFCMKYFAYKLFDCDFIVSWNNIFFFSILSFYLDFNFFAWYNQKRIVEWESEIRMI